MKESEVAYVAGVIDSTAQLRVKVSKNDNYSTGYQLRPRINIHRSGNQQVVLGMIDEYASEIGVLPEIQEKTTTSMLAIEGVDDIPRFIQPIEPWLIQKHEQLQIFLEDVLPALEEGRHHTKEGMVEVMELVDEMYENDPSIKDWKYSAGYFKQKWSNELA